ncbi:MAG TPA: DUF6600 domain-containing protein [Polyangia bacterium]|nr:DUF6600 domain-containing protein [Polyangia bacterium]
MRRALFLVSCLAVSATSLRASGRPPGCAERASQEARTSRPAWRTDIDPNLYVNSLDTVLTYDDQLNERDYDDGYEPTAYKSFEAALAPYGTWAETKPLGRVWFPSSREVGSRFVPYATNGQWVRTEYGWTWISGWAWGWAPFHYGRWAVLPGRGWGWIPGTLWSPAWVAWRQGRNFVAWAPLPPEGMSLGRPLGPRSPWSMARARTFATPAMELVPARVLPSLFARTTALSNPEPIEIGPYTVQVNAGPRRVGPDTEDASVVKLASVDPEVGPRATIRPYSGSPLESRPWVQQHFRDQTPLCRWSGPPGEADRGPCWPVTP